MCDDEKQQEIKEEQQLEEKTPCDGQKTRTQRWIDSLSDCA